MNLQFEDIQTVANEMKRHHFNKLYALPYNRYNVERNDFWWLSPTSEKAAFKYAKFIFTSEETWIDYNSVFCGFHIEKGLPPGGAANPNHEMDKTWFWHQFLNEIDSSLPKKIEAANEVVEENLDIMVNAQHLVENAPQNRVLFQADKSTLSIINHDDGEGALNKLLDVTNYSQLSEALKLVTDNDAKWHWIGISIGKTYTLNPDGSDDSVKCSQMLRCFRDWITEA